MTNKLFENPFVVDVDLSYVGVTYAAEQYRIHKHGEPNHVYYNGYKPEYVSKVDSYLKAKGLNYTFIKDHRYQKGSWSVGTVTECGYGSVGS